MKYLLSLIALFFALSLTAQSNTYFGWIDKSAKFIENNQLDSAMYALQSAMKLDPANESNAVLLLPRQEVIFNAPLVEIVEVFIGKDGPFPGDIYQLLHISRVKVGDAPVADQAGSLQILQALDGFC